MKIIKLNIITLLFFSCSIIPPELEWEDVESDHESVLNILGILSTDSLVSSFVKVHKSLNVQDNIDSLVLDTTSGIDFYRISKFVVVDAEVIVRQGSDEYRFEYSEIEMETGDTVGLGAYFYNGDDLNPIPGEVYFLSVSTPSGMYATGEVTIPPKPHLHKEELPDTFKVNDIIDIKWDVLSEHNQLLNIDNFLNFSGSYIMIMDLIIIMEIILCHVACSSNNLFILAIQRGRLRRSGVLIMRLAKAHGMKIYF